MSSCFLEEAYKTNSSTVAAKTLFPPLGHSEKVFVLYGGVELSQERVPSPNNIHAAALNAPRAFEQDEAYKTKVKHSGGQDPFPTLGAFSIVLL